MLYLSGMENFETAVKGSKYFYPSTSGRALTTTVVGKADHSLVVRVGKTDTIYIESNLWNEYAVPYPRIDILDVIDDNENQIIFVRYRENTTWVDRLYNWYNDRIMKRVLRRNVPYLSDKSEELA